MSPELRTRLLLGIPLAVAMVAMLLFGNAELTSIVAGLAGLRAWWEYIRMMNIRPRKFLGISGYLILAFLFVDSFFKDKVEFFWVWFIWVVGFFLLYFETLVDRAKGRPTQTSDSQKTWTDFVRFTMGIIYVFMMFGVVGPITKHSMGHSALLMAVSIIAIGDSAAYFVGRKFGRHKLWPELSPKKSFEGAIAAILFSLIAAAVCWRFLFQGTELSLARCLVFAAVASPLAQAGDFLESLMKRASGTKDSGGIFPGHGGMLDRADGFALVMPLVYLLLMII